MSTSSSRRGFLSSAVASGIGLAAPLEAQSPSSPKAPGAMPFRTLGKTGLKVSVLGFGCMTTSDPTVIERAADQGINYFDTARVYQNGNNERMVGAALKGRRDRIVLSSKTPARTGAEAMETLNTSLKELATDHLDIWYLHSRSKPEDAPDEFFDVQDEARRQGKIRFRGVSFHSGHKEMFAYLIAKKRTDVILTSYNFSMAAEMDQWIGQAAKAGIGIVAMKVMAGGFRANKPGSPMREKLSHEGVCAAALKWAVRSPNVHTSIPGITDMDQLDENYRAVCDGFKDGDTKLLAAQLRYITPLYCRMCGTCSGKCAQGLPVSDLIRYVSYAEGYGEFDLGRQNYLSEPLHVQQARCTSCDQCTIHCPNGVRVAERVARAQELFA